MEIFIFSMLAFIIISIVMIIQAIPNMLFTLAVGLGAIILCIYILYRIFAFLEDKFDTIVALVFVLIIIFASITGFIISENSDLVASIYVVTSDSNYVKEEDMGLFGPIYYTTIPSGTIVSWVYHKREAYPKGKYYIYTGDANYRALPDFYERGNSWNLKHIKTITYKEFKKSKWWENIQQDSDDLASKASKLSAEQNEEEITSKEEEDARVGESLYLDACNVLEFDEYQGNEGDSFVYPIGQHQFTRGQTDIFGKTYSHGIEAWIARWNDSEEKSWASAVFDVPERMKSLTGEVVIINSYNTTDFDSTLTFIDADTESELKSYHLTPNNLPLEFSVSIAGTQKLKILVADNRAVAGGTSFGLVNALLKTEKIAGNNGIPSDAVSYNDHYYKLFDLGGTFEEAEEYCLSLGGYLAVISDQKENDFLFSYMKSCGYENTYFGFSDQEDEGVWAWLGTEEKSSFTNWASDEPNHESDAEDYAMFFYGYPDGKWNDGTFGNGTNSDDTAFLCEWKGTGFTSETRKEEEIQSPFPQKYWIIFTEGSRGDRVEASSIDSSIDPDKLCFIWDSGIDLNNMAGSGDCNQFFLNDSGKWEKIGTYYRMSGDATKILYSSLDVYDADGNLILEKCSINDIDWERIREFNRTAR